MDGDTTLGLHVLQILKVSKESNIELQTKVTINYKLIPPGSGLTGLNVVNTIVIEVFDEQLDSKADADGGHNDAHGGDDDDGQVEEVAPVRVLHARASPLEVTEHCALHHF